MFLLYTVETARTEIERIHQEGTYRSINTIKKNKELVVFIEDEFKRNYPFENESLSAKIWLLFHEKFNLYCICGKRLKYKKSRNGMQFNCVSSCSVTIENRNKTMISKYGVVGVQKIPEIKAKSIATCLLRYGSKSANGNEVVMKKQIATRKNKCLKLYGVGHEKQAHFSIETQKILRDRDKFAEMIKKFGSREMAKRLGISQSTVVVYHRKLGLSVISRVRSCYEIELASWLTSIDVKFTQNDLKQIKPKELDFYLPEYKIGIEIQGNYWHGNPKLYKSTDLIRSNRGLISVSEIWEKDKYKRYLCEQKGIRLIAFWEDDWIRDSALIKAMILKKMKERINTCNVTQEI